MFSYFQNVPRIVGHRLPCLRSHEDLLRLPNSLVSNYSVIGSFSRRIRGRYVSFRSLICSLFFLTCSTLDTFGAKGTTFILLCGFRDFGTPFTFTFSFRKWNEDFMIGICRYFCQRARAISVHCHQYIRFCR